MSKKVVVAPASFGLMGKAALDLLSGKGYSLVQTAEGSHFSAEELEEHLKDADALIISTDPVPGSLIEKCPKLKIIAKYGVGLDNIDLETAIKNEVLVTTTPGANTESVADLTFGLLLAVTRRIPELDRSMKAEIWEKLMGSTIYGKSIGIIGTGMIGKAVISRALGFNMNVLCYDVVRDPRVLKINPEKVRYVDLNELLAGSDFISIHIPLTDETKGMIGRDEIGMMKPSAYIINTARAGIINEQELKKAVRSGKLAGAGFDVYEYEPPKDWELVKSERVVATPHVAVYTCEALELMAMSTAESIIKTFEGEVPVSAVNYHEIENHREGKA